MVAVRLSPFLVRQFPIPDQCAVAGVTVAEVVNDLDRQYSGIAGYLLHEDGSLREHVNIFVDEHLVQDRDRLLDSTENAKEVVIMQALSGG